MTAIFVSHSNLDSKITSDIKDWLFRQGFERVFLDFDKVTGIGAGESWETRLYEELRRCHAVVLVMTQNWLASKWCFAELTQARAQGKVILPILCESLGDRIVLPEIQAVDVLDWNSGGLDRLEKRLRAITNELARGFMLEPNRPPYPGIHTFEAEDAAIYFGRDEESRGVIERLDARRAQGGARFLLVIGASGSGKSSLLKAGVLPQLARRRTQWKLLPCMRPERAPLEAFAKIIAQQIGAPGEWRAWHKTLASNSALDQVEEALKDLRVGDSRTAKVLLPIDQFEEIFTVAVPAERTGFLRVLASALNPARDLPLMVIATGRSDVLSGLIEESGLAGTIETYLLESMPLDRILRVVEGPAEVASLNVERGLSEIITHDLERPDALPLLAHALWLLYQRSLADKKLTLGNYRALGDPERGLNPIENSVRLVADRAIVARNPSGAELAALRDAFVPHLVRIRLDDGKRVRQPAHVTQLPQESLRLVSALVEARLLSTRAVDGTSGEATDQSTSIVEVTHEALFKAWPMLEKWLTEEQSFLTDLERIKAARDIWTQAAEEHKSKALLGGILLSRAREWLRQYPQRFQSPELEVVRCFITLSVAAEDAALAQARALRDHALSMQSRFLADMASQHCLRGDCDTAVALALEGLPDDRRGIARPYVAAAESALYQSALKLHERLARHGKPVLGAQERLVLKSFADDADVVTSVAFSCDGCLVLSSGLKNAWVWDAASDTLIAVLSGHTEKVNRAAFCKDGSQVVTASNDGTARLWDARTGTALATLSGHTNKVKLAVFSPDGSRILTASYDKTARLWDASSGRQLAVMPGHTAQLSSEVALNTAAISPDGNRIVTASWDCTARTWDARTGAALATLTGHTHGVRSVAFSPDGTRVVTASEDKTARIWDSESGKELILLCGHQNLVNTAAFSTDQRRLVTGSGDKTACIWDAASGGLISVLRGHQGAINTAAFSPNGQRVITASGDNKARIWDVEGGAEIAVVRGYAAEFSPDGLRVVTACRYSAEIWPSFSTTQELIDRMRTVATFELSAEQRVRFFLDS